MGSTGKMACLRKIYEPESRYLLRRINLLLSHFSIFVLFLRNLGFFFEKPGENFLQELQCRDSNCVNNVKK